MQLIGSTTTAPAVGEALHPQLEKVWSVILTEGLNDDVRVELLTKYPVPSNCPALGAPKLNDEVKIVTQQSTQNRDVRVCLTQTQIGASLAALGRALNVLVAKEDLDDQSRLMIETLSDAARILSDLHHTESDNRRKFIFLDKGINSAYKEKLIQVPVDDFLFGKDLSDRLKSSKELERASSALKMPNV